MARPGTTTGPNGARAASPGAPGPPEPPDWPAQAAERVERAVAMVRDRTTGPAVTIARGLVYGVFAAIVVTAALVMAAIGAVRALDVYLPEAVLGQENTWAAHMIVGVLFCLAGMLLWSRRRASGGS